MRVAYDLEFISESLINSSNSSQHRSFMMVCRQINLAEVDFIMSINPFFPSTHDEQIVWLSHYSLKLPINGPVCGISDQEINETQTDLTYYIWMLQHGHPSVQRDAKDSTVYKTMMVSGSGNASINYPQPSVFPNAPAAPTPGIKIRLMSQINRIKVSLKYTDAIGHDLGIISSTNTTEHLVPIPNVLVELGSSGQRVTINFNKYGHDGVWIESRTNGGDWVFLAVDTLTHYYDERPLAAGNIQETREYRLRWWDKSVAHGEWSNVLTALIGS